MKAIEEELFCFILSWKYMISENPVLWPSVGLDLRIMHVYLWKFNVYLKSNYLCMPVRR